jgi:hypothetical protein
MDTKYQLALPLCAKLRTDIEAKSGQRTRGRIAVASEFDSGGRMGRLFFGRGPQSTSKVDTFVGIFVIGSLVGEMVNGVFAAGALVSAEPL